MVFGQILADRRGIQEGFISSEMLLCTVNNVGGCRVAPSCKCNKVITHKCWLHMIAREHA